MPLNLSRRLQKLYRCATYQRRLRQPAAVILLYHRVCELKSDPQQLAVTPEHFAEHLQIIRKNYQAISLAELINSLHAGEVPRNTVVVTFDDGYLDNLEVAKPQFLAARIPATFFISSAYLGKNREFWWDDVERVLLATPALPIRLNLEVTDPCATFSAVVSSLEERMEAYQKLLPWMRARTPAQLESIRQQLQTWAGVGSAGRPSHGIMSPADLQAFDSDPLIEIGAHTRLHPSLAALSPDEQRDEIAGGKRDLESILGHAVNTFSFPFGTRADYTSDTMRLVQEAGYHCALANWPERISASADLWQLPRFLVRDWPGAEFAQRLKNFFLPAI